MTRPTAARLAAGLALLAALAPAPAAGQPQPDPTAERPAPPLVYYTLMYLRDPAFHAELKLTADQAKAVTDLIPKLGAAFRAGRPESKEREEAGRVADKALGDAIGADRLRRAKQITLQQLEGVPTGLPAAIVYRIPEVADALKFTAEQKARLSARNFPFNGIRLTSVLETPRRRSGPS